MDHHNIAVAAVADVSFIPSNDHYHPQKEIKIE
jgi:hypothetical protein